MIRVLIKKLPKTRQNVVLDLGCGTGILGLMFARNRVYTIFIDVDIDAIVCTYMNTKLNRADAWADVVQCYSATCIRSKSVDIVISNPPYLPCSTDFGYQWCSDLDQHIVMDMTTESFRVGRKVMVVLSSFCVYTPIFMKMCRKIISERVLDEVVVYFC